jgi:hypothetical protein
MRVIVVHHSKTQIRFTVMVLAPSTGVKEIVITHRFSPSSVFQDLTLGISNRRIFFQQ